MLDPKVSAIFWARSERVQELREGASAILRGLGLNERHLLDEILKPWWEKQPDIATKLRFSHRTLSRFFNEETELRSDLQKSALLLSLGDFIAEENIKHHLAEADEQHRGAIAALSELYALLQIGATGSSTSKTAAGSPNSRVDSSIGIEEIFNLIASLLGLSAVDLSEPAHRFFTPEELNRGEREVHFEGFRFDSVAGKVVKSFFAIKRPDALSPVCHYSQFYKDHYGRKKASRGIILPFHGAYAFVGSVDKGEGIEVVTFRRRRFASEICDGLMLTLDDEGSPVAGRLSLSRTDARNDEEAGTGILEVSDLDEATRKIADRCRNRMRFTLERKVLYEERRLEARDVVTLVQDLLIDEDGKSTLKHDDGSDFNPASTDEYTFNVALTISRPDGRE